MKYFRPIFKPGKNLRPPDLYEYFVDNFWFKAAGLDDQAINEPLRGSHKADLIAGESNNFTNYFIVNRKTPYVGPKFLRGFFGQGVKWMLKNLDYSPFH